jgi:hypothetical protein
VDLEQANRLVLALLGTYEPVFKQAGGNPGVPFTQAYDTVTVKPRQEWEKLYREVKAEVRQMGLTALDGD